MYLVIDTETTGLPNYKLPKNNLKQPRIVQIAAILFDDEGKTHGKLSTVIKPDGWVIPDEVAKLHGIDQARAIREGIPMAIAFSHFRNLVAQADKIIAHNIAFDKFLVEVEAVKLGFREPTWNGKKLFCTMKESVDITKIPPTEAMKAKRMFCFKAPNLTELHTHFFGEGFDGAHDALVDVEACIRCYLEIMKLRAPKAA